MLDNNYVFIKKYISKHRAGCSCNLYIARNCTQENVRCHIQHKEKWLSNRNWTGKLLFSTYISWKKLWSHTFKVSSEKVIVYILRKWRQNAWRGMCERVFFVKLKVGISQLHNRLTSSQIIFRHFKYINVFE